MGLFDDLTVEFPLSYPGANAVRFQTKDTPAQYMDKYCIRADGTLWYEDHDTEDRSDPNAEGIMRLRGIMTKVNKRWIPCPNFTGEIRFYAWEPDALRHIQWIEYSSYFLKGQIQSMTLIELELRPQYHFTAFNLPTP